MDRDEFDARQRERLRWLFGNILRWDKKPFSSLDVAKAVGTSETWISQLRSGKRRNPTWDRLLDIAEFFQVPASYFTVDEVSARRLEEEILRRRAEGGPVLTDEAVRALMDTVIEEAAEPHQITDSDRVQIAALRDAASVLSAEDVREIYTMIDAVVARAKERASGTPRSNE